MSTDQLKEVLVRLYEAFSRGDFPALDHIIDEDFIEHESMPPRLSPNREGILRYIHMLRGAFPDIQYCIQDMAAEKDKVWARVRITGTQRDEFAGIPATGRPVVIEVVDIYRFCRGRVIEHWSVTDQLSMVQQMGGYLATVGMDLERT